MAKCDRDRLGCAADRINGSTGARKDDVWFERDDLVRSPVECRGQIRPIACIETLNLDCLSVKPSKLDESFPKCAHRWVRDVAERRCQQPS